MSTEVVPPSYAVAISQARNKGNGIPEVRRQSSPEKASDDIASRTNPPDANAKSPAVEIVSVADQPGKPAPSRIRLAPLPAHTAQPYAPVAAHYDKGHRSQLKNQASAKAAPRKADSDITSSTIDTHTQNFVDRSSDRQGQPSTERHSSDRQTKPTTDRHTQPNIDRHSQTATDRHGQLAGYIQPTADRHSQSSSERNAQPAIDLRSQSSADRHTIPAIDRRSQPSADRHTQPIIDRHSQSSADRQTQPTTDRQTQSHSIHTQHAAQHSNDRHQLLAVSDRHTQPLAAQNPSSSPPASSTASSPYPFPFPQSKSHPLPWHATPTPRAGTSIGQPDVQEFVQIAQTLAAKHAVVGAGVGVGVGVVTGLGTAPGADRDSKAPVPPPWHRQTTLSTDPFRSAQAVGVGIVSTPSLPKGITQSYVSHTQPPPSQTTPTAPPTAPPQQQVASAAPRQEVKPQSSYIEERDKTRNAQSMVNFRIPTKKSRGALEGFDSPKRRDSTLQDGTAESNVEIGKIATPNTSTPAEIPQKNSITRKETKDVQAMRKDNSEDATAKAQRRARLAALNHADWESLYWYEKFNLAKNSLSQYVEPALGVRAVASFAPFRFVPMGQWESH